jgi:hypothetical protein
LKDGSAKPLAHVNTPRRHALGALGAMSALPVIALPATTEAAERWIDSFSADDLAAAGRCVLIPEEIAGPYPLYKIYDDPKFVRRNITEGRTGVALELSLKIVNVNDGCTPLEGAQVYVWHTDKDGEYSGYVQGPRAVHHGLSGLVSGPHHAHACSGSPGDRNGGHHADRVSAKGDDGGV